MPIPTIENLKEEIYALPEQLNQALGKKVEAELEVSRIKRAIKKLEAQLKKEEEQKEEQGDYDTGNEDTEIIETERELRELEMELTETESRVELDYRNNHQKVTESQVRAAVRDNEDVKKLKRKIAEQKIKGKTQKHTLRRERHKAFIPRRPYLERFEPESVELSLLQEELSTAEGESMKAEIEVETLQAKLNVFKILVQIIAL